MNRSAAARRQVISVLAAAGVLAALWGCAGKPPPPPPAAPKVEKPPPELFVQVNAARDANRGPSGQALPIVVRLYELKSEGAFTAADFYSLYDKESATLGPSLIARDEVSLAPGQQRTLTRMQGPGAKQLGVLAAFRDIDQATWRAVVNLTPDTSNTVQVEVGPNAVKAQLR